MELFKVTLTFCQPLLGTVPLNREVYSTYVAAKRPDNDADAEEELATIEEELEQGTTGFHKVDGAPFLYDYQIKGFFKDACSMLRREKGSRSSKLTAHKKIIDGMVFVYPRRIPIELSGPITYVERPLRAQTAQGERIALARSEAAPEGSKISFTVKIRGGMTGEDLREWLEYGADRGLGQWRNSGAGRFEFTMEPVE